MYLTDIHTRHPSVFAQPRHWLREPLQGSAAEPQDRFEASNPDDNWLPRLSRMPSQSLLIGDFQTQKFLRQPTGVWGVGAKVGFGALGLVGGAVQTHRGMLQIERGQYVEGGLTCTGGVATMTGGAASIAAGSGAGGVAMRCLGPGAFGVAAVADGVGNIYNGIKAGDGEQVAVGGLKTAAGGLLIAGACTMNPVLVASGAAVYLGAWTYENRDAIANFAVKTGDAIANGVGRTIDAVQDGAMALAAGAANVAGQAVDAVQDGAVAVATGVVNVAGQAVSSVGNGAGALWRGATSWFR
jgi:hypothetical protein